VQALLREANLPRAEAPTSYHRLMRAADALMEALKAEGVEHIFGIPGGANLPTYDAFYDAGIRHVLGRHEAGGGNAAEGYAKATGRVGVAFGTSGPGFQGTHHSKVAVDEQGGRPGHELAVGRFGVPHDRAGETGQPVVLPDLNSILAVGEINHDEMGFDWRYFFPGVEGLLQTLGFNLFQKRVGIDDLDLGHVAKLVLKIVAQLALDLVPDDRAAVRIGRGA